MHKHHESGEAVSAPEPVRKAINLVEEFFGLTLADGAYYPFRDDRRHDDDGDHFLGYLMSPTGGRWPVTRSSTGGATGGCWSRGGQGQSLGRRAADCGR